MAAVVLNFPMASQEMPCSLGSIHAPMVVLVADGGCTLWCALLCRFLGLSMVCMM